MVAHKNIRTPMNLARQGKATILLVDDVPESLTVLSHLLEEYGYRVRTAINGTLALKTISKALPDLILLDIAMPDMDGYEVCTRIKANEQSQHIPVIFISAMDEVMDKVRAFSVGGIDYITKPFQIEEVLVRIENQLQIQRTQNELHISESRYRAAKEAAEESNRAKSTFLANMSHELRTPLNTILGFAQIMLRSNTLDPEHRESIAIIHRSGEHLLTLINSVLELSKIEAGCVALSINDFDLYRMIRDLEDMFYLRAINKHLHLIFEYTADTPQYIRTDEVRLRQILANLLSNAIKFTSSGTVTVRMWHTTTHDAPMHPARLAPEYAQQNDTDTDSVSTNQESAPAKTDNPDVWLHVAVEDTGSGIPPHDLATIFDAFTQTQVGREAHEGTGLGLTISHRFVELLRGTLRVQSEEGHGTTFTVSIPVGLAAPFKATTKPIERRIIGLASGQQEYRILIADDQWDNRYLLVKLLTPLGFNVYEANNGQEAVQVWQTKQPHLIFMDMRMPVMTGYDATRHITSSSDQHPPVIIALTASAFEEERTAILDAGCNNFIRKPFRDTEIFAMIEKYLDLRFEYEPATSYEATKEPEEQHEDDQPQKRDVATLTQMLADIPAEYRDMLHRGAVLGDIDMISQVIIHIRSYNTQLGDKIETLAYSFQFEHIVTLIRPYVDNT